MIIAGERATIIDSILHLVEASWSGSLFSAALAAANYRRGFDTFRHWRIVSIVIVCCIRRVCLLDPCIALYKMHQCVCIKFSHIIKILQFLHSSLFTIAIMSITGSTAVLTCCKGDAPSQWETPIFRPQQIRNPLTDFDKICYQ